MSVSNGMGVGIGNDAIVVVNDNNGRDKSNDTGTKIIATTVSDHRIEIHTTNSKISIFRIVE